MTENEFLLIYDQYQNRLRIGKRLFKSACSFHKALINLKEIEEKRIKTLLSIKTFLNEFYNESSEYKEIVSTFADIFSFQIDNIEKQVSLKERVLWGCD